MLISSIRSRSGLEILRRELAVAMKRTLDKSKSMSMKLSWNALFCSGSSTSSRADSGSPL